MATTTRTITIPTQLDPVAVLGPVDEVLREVERAFPDLTIIVRGNRIAIMSRSKQTESQAARAEEVVNTIIQAAYTAPMDADTVRRMLDQDILSNRVRRTHPGHGVVTETLRRALPETPTRRDQVSQHHKPHVPGVITFANGAPVRAKTAGQVAYVNAIESHTVTFAIGPAGSGKTYLAVAKAVRAFQDRKVRRIILTRPAVEAGENLEHACRRETKEEVGIDLGEVRYLGSQPWPFPASLMVAFKAYALNTDIRTDGQETVDARWVSRDEYTAELVRGVISAPNRTAIARYMIEEWYGRAL